MTSTLNALQLAVPNKILHHPSVKNIADLTQNCHLSRRRIYISAQRQPLFSSVDAKEGFSFNLLILDLLIIIFPLELKRKRTVLLYYFFIYTLCQLTKGNQLQKLILFPPGHLKEMFRNVFRKGISLTGKNSIFIRLGNICILLGHFFFCCRQRMPWHCVNRGIPRSRSSPS